MGAPDPFRLSFRLGTLRTGVWPTLLVCLNTSIYLGLSWHEPHRAVLMTIIAMAAGSAVAIALLPMERIVTGRLCEPFFLGWTCSLIVMITVASALDGGTYSPLSALYFLPLVYAALSYPLRSMAAVGIVNLVAYLGLIALTDDPSGFHVFLMAAALINAGWICTWQSHNHDRHRRHLDEVSRTDPLTGCLNRRGFQQGFERDLALARRRSESLALVVIDLDHFKEVNDRQGHAAGDELLCWVGTALRGVVRAEDAVARLGGDEFALVLRGTDPAPIVSRVRSALAERAPASAGTALFPFDATDPEALHRVADAALYADKHGRRRAPVAEPA